MPILRGEAPRRKTTAEQCRDAGGLLKTNLGKLRFEINYLRLGSGVLGEIREALEHQDLGYFPLDRLDPNVNTAPRQEHVLWVYDRSESSLIGRVVDAVLDPENNDVDAAFKGLIREHVEQLTATQKIARIRELLATPERKPVKKTTVQIRPPKGDLDVSV